MDRDPITTALAENPSREKAEKILTALEALVDVGSVLVARTGKPSLKLGIVALRASIKAVKAYLATRTGADLYLAVDNTNPPTERKEDDIVLH